MTRLTSSIVAVVLLGAPVVSLSADLRAGMVKYDGGAALYRAQASQNVVCDNCPAPPQLEPAPAPKAVRFTPPPSSPTPITVETEVIPVIQVESKPRTTQTVVYFTFNSAKLSPSEKLRIRTALAAEAGNSVAVKVDGYACRIGTKAYNKSLSAKRAKAVAEYARSLGANVTVAEGLGKKSLGGPLSKDRRAVIIIKERNYIP